MKLTCPSCGQIIPAQHIGLDTGWAKCSECQELFRLADVLPGYVVTATSAAERIERPFDAWAVVERTPKTLIVSIPPQGMRAGTWSLLGFAAFWLAFIAFWTAGALGIFFVGNNGGGIHWENGRFAAFSTPFWLVGFGMLAGILWSSCGSRSVYLDPAQMVTELRCTVWRRMRTWDRSEVQCAQGGVVTVQHNNDQGTYTPFSVEIIRRRGSFKLPCNSSAEKDWLLAEINVFLQAVPYNAAEGQFNEQGMPLRDSWQARRSSSLLRKDA